MTGGDRRISARAFPPALLVTEREFVLIAEEKYLRVNTPETLHHFGRIITYIPIAQLINFQLSQHERFDVLAFQMHAMHGGEALEIIFPADHEKVVSELMRQVFAHAGQRGHLNCEDKRRQNRGW